MSTYQIDSAHSSAQFKVRHMMIANVKGEFDKVTGTVNFDPANPATSTVEASIDASTISTRDGQRDGHLKSPDFLDVEKFPAITFKSKKVTSTGGDSFNVVGDLTIHGTTKEVNLNVEELTGEAKDPWGNMRRGATGVAGPAWVCSVRPTASWVTWSVCTDTSTSADRTTCDLVR